MSHNGFPLIKTIPEDPDKKQLRKISNAFTVPLILQQVFGIAAILISAVAVMLLRAVLLKNLPAAFNLTVFLHYISESDNSDLLNNIFYDLTYLSYMFLPFIIILAMLKQNPFKLIPMRVRHADMIFPVIVIGLLLSIIGEFYSDYFGSLLQLFRLKVELDQFSFPNNTPALIVYAIQLSVLAPLCEEFVFRGVILQNLRKYGNFFAVLVSSAMFGILHGNLAQTPFAFIVGIGLALAVLETGSIWVSILLHCLVNSISLVFDGLSYYYSDRLANFVYSYYLLVIAFLAVCVIISLRRRHYFENALNRYAEAPMPAPVAVAAVVKAPGCVLFIIIYVLSMFLSLKPF